jgi:probable phosphoglycerate mutase
MNAKTIYIIRHGQTDFNLKRIIQGSGVDSSLNETGRNQAAQFHQAYQDLNFELVITSALQRTHQTAGPFINKNIPWIQMPELNEINWGIHEGKEGTPQMVESYNHITNQWKSGNYNIGIEEGETAQALQDRLNIFIETIKQRDEKLVLVCSHGRAMRCLICLLDGKPIKHMDDYGHHNTGLYIVQQTDNNFEIKLSNDISHLKEG